MYCYYSAIVVYELIGEGHFLHENSVMLDWNLMEEWLILFIIYIMTFLDRGSVQNKQTKKVLLEKKSQSKIQVNACAGFTRVGS